ncbi:GerAB/ArcD/ProY family transporter [Pseudalkalibacillus hwajinpoensis]|uniref:GerAB/ArcD/ProY family transporter n=1 Tax=Guptibacillus hwajinpoensis TaxID=208199 RepID=UPI00146D93E3|nr:endospore germination permease [Pseudalkalibacillus hwajinpoensis]
MKREILSSRQFTWLVSLYIIGSSILIIPSSLAGEAKQDAWMAATLAGVIGILLVVFYSLFIKNFPDLTFVQANERILGKWMGKIVSLSFFSFTFLLAALVLRNIGDFFTTQILIETPLEVIFAVFLVVIIMGARLGIETIARACEIFFPWVFGLLFILVVLLLPEIKVENIQPVFDGGFKPILRATLPFIGLPFLELIIFLMIHPSVNATKSIRRDFLKGTIVGGLMLFVVIVLCLLVLGVDFTARNAYPTYVLAKKVNIGQFIQRIEVIVAIIWMLSIYFKLVLLYYVSALGLSQVIEMEDYRPLLFPLGIITIVLAQISYPDIVYVQEFISKTWIFYASTYGFLLPVFLLLIARIRKII